MLSTSVFVVTSIVGLMLWEIGLRTGQPVPRLLALALPVLVGLELIHTVALVEPLSHYTDLRPAGDALARRNLGADELFPAARDAGDPVPAGARPAARRRFLGGLVVLAAALLVLFEALPRYAPPIWLGITTPPLILAPFVWAAAGWLCWRWRAQSEILRMFALMAAIMVAGEYPDALFAHLRRRAGDDRAFRQVPRQALLLDEPHGDERNRDGAAAARRSGAAVVEHCSSSSACATAPSRSSSRTMR